MQATSLRGRSEMANGVSSWSDPEYTLNVAMVYWDALTRQWAEKVHNLIADLVGEQAIHLTEWRVSDLREPSTYSKGVVALARADVILVSLPEAERFAIVFLPLG